VLGALIIVFREVIEAGLIVGIVLAVTRGVHSSRAMILAGVAAGVVGASLVAGFAGVIANALAGVGQEIFNASILLVAVVMLIWHNVWMASHGRELAANVKRVGDAVRTGSSSVVALGVVCAVAVMREGSEVALFMYGLVAAGGSTSSELLVGAVLGLLAGAGVASVTYLSSCF
jgi:high-affinity iron transporter